MLLSDLDIAKRLVEKPDKKLVVTPIINAAQQFGPSSLDVHLSTDFQRLENINKPFLEFDQLPEDDRAYTERIVLPASGRFYLHPGEFVLASTLLNISNSPQILRAE